MGSVCCLPNRSGTDCRGSQACSRCSARLRPPVCTTCGEATDGPAARAVARNTGAGKVVGGRYYLDGQTLRAEVHVVDPMTGAQIYTFDTVEGPRDQTGRVIDQIASRVMGAVAMHTESQAGLAGDGSLYRPSLYEVHVEIRLAEKTVDAPAKEDHLRKAFNLDPHDLRVAVRLFDLIRVNPTRRAEAETFWNAVGASYSRFTPYEQASYRLSRARFEGKWLEYLEGAKAQDI